MNTVRIALLLAVFGAYLAAALSQDDPAVSLLGLAMPAWLALEACWRLLDPKR
jgi:hypothetical protein